MLQPHAGFFFDNRAVFVVGDAAFWAVPKVEGFTFACSHCEGGPRARRHVSTGLT